MKATKVNILKQWTNKIIQGDCLELMRELPPNSIDTIITDPPGAISFMGQDWDSDKGGRDNWIAWLSDIMKECLRVAKPGAMLVCWSIPRTSYWTGMAIDVAGWMVRDVITYLQGASFPKSLNVSKQIDKLKGIEREIIYNPLSKLTPKSDKIVQVSHSTHKLGEPKTFEKSVSPEAKLWDGFGTGLKPAVEMWWLAMKPLDGTFAENALKWGVAGLNIDRCRISYRDADAPVGRPAPINPKYDANKSPFGQLKYKDMNDYSPTSSGRFPANLILSHHPECRLVGETEIGTGDGAYIYDDKEYDVDGFIKKCKPKAPSNYGKETVEVWECHPDCPVRMLDEQSGVLTSGGKAGVVKHNSTGLFVGKYHKDFETSNYGDKGGPSRFFYCAKASGDDRDDFNIHETVKPVELMKYLCKLTSTPTGGIVLDPFAGSGSTLVAAELVGRPFIGFELEEKYIEIIKRRLAYTGVGTKEDRVKAGVPLTFEDLCQ